MVLVPALVLAFAKMTSDSPARRGNKRAALKVGAPIGLGTGLFPHQFQNLSNILKLTPL